jgi:hypothetical protein
MYVEVYVLLLTLVRTYLTKKGSLSLAGHQKANFRRPAVAKPGAHHNIIIIYIIIYITYLFYNGDAFLRTYELRVGLRSDF